MCYISETPVNEDEYLRFRISERFNRILRDVYRVPLKTALKRENEIVAPRARKVSESLLAQGEET